MSWSRVTLTVPSIEFSSGDEADVGPASADGLEDVPEARQGQPVRLGAGQPGCQEPPR